MMQILPMLILSHFKSFFLALETSRKEQALQKIHQIVQLVKQEFFGLSDKTWVSVMV
jgi:hypothetical protein